MATRIFISSTSRDLHDFRRDLIVTLKDMGHDPVASERHEFYANPHKDTFDSCLDEVEASDILILVLDQRYGSRYPGSEKSIVRMEYERARALGKPTFVLVSSKAMLGKELYFLNDRDRKVKYGVDDPDIFDFITEIETSKYGNWVHVYQDSRDAREWIKAQLSALLKDYLNRKVQDSHGASTALRRRAHGRSGDRDAATALSQKLGGVFERLNFSYKPVLFLALWRNPTATGNWTLEAAAELFLQYYVDRCDRLLPVEVNTSDLHNPRALSVGEVMRILWDGPIQAMRGRILETEGTGGAARIRLRPEFQSAERSVKEAVVARAEQALADYYDRISDGKSRT